jgi:hypothetical protein
MHRHEMQQSNIYLGIFNIEYYFLLEKSGCYKKFAAQVLELEEKVLGKLTELCAKELSLERTTKANEDYKSQNARLTKKLERKLSSPLPLGSCIFT